MNMDIRQMADNNLRGKFIRIHAGALHNVPAHLLKAHNRCRVVGIKCAHCFCTLLIDKARLFL